MTITPGDLPNRVSNFIAYGPEERAPDPANEGQVITVRPQVYVRYYPGLVVSNLQEGGRSGDRKGLVTVHFDPASIGFKDPISAHMNDDDQTLNVLRNSQENKVPLAVAIETQRKKKNSETGAPISPLTPVHALRGASHPNGDGDGPTMMGPSGNNTSNRVAFVNGVGTQHLQSDPMEWKSLVNNKAGDLPPEGWRRLITGEDWTQIGAAVRDGAPGVPQSGGTAAPGEFPTPNELGNLIHSVVAQTLKEFAPTLANQVAQSSTPQGRPAGKFDEGRQWHPRTSDGRINLGGFVVSSERWVFEWAYRYLTTGLEVEASPEDAWTLSEAALKMASTVQATAYGHGFISDRTSASHREAEHWVQWTIANVHAYPGSGADEETLAAWTEEVVKDASGFLAEAGRRAGDYFSEVSKRDKNGAAPQSKTETAPSGPSEKVIRAFLDVVQKGWDNPETLRNLGAQARDNGYFDYPIPVSMAATDEGVRLSYPPAEDEETGPLESLLIYRLKTLVNNGTPEGQTTAPQGDNQPEQEQAPSQEATPPVSDSPQEAEGTQPAQDQGQSAPAQQDGGDQVASVIERLKAVASEQELRAIFEEARDANLTAAKAFVARGANGEVIFGQEGEDGFQAQAIGAVIGVMRQAFVAPAEEPKDAEQNASAMEAAPTQDEAPEQTEDTQEASQEPETAPAETEPDNATSEAPEAPEDAQPEAAPEAPAQDADTDGEAQRIADAAGTASTPEELEALKSEAEQKGLTESPVLVGGTDGLLGLWLVHQTRRINRAQRARR